MKRIATLSPDSTHGNDSKTPAKRPSLNNLPPELKLVILHSLPDFDSLKAIILTSASFHKLYMRSQQSILLHLINRQIPDQIITEAAAWYEIANLGFLDAPEIRKFLETNDGPRESRPTEWPIKMLLEILIFHSQYIQFFVGNYSNFCLSKNPVNGNNDSRYNPLSSSENLRIQRSLFRFEMYSNLFRKRKDWKEQDSETYDDRETLVVEEQNELFLSRYPPWEIEEICCIHYYLHQRLSHSMDEVLRHNPEMTEFVFVSQILNASKLNDEHKESFLSLGLTFVYETMSTSDYDKWKDLYRHFIHSDWEWLPNATSHYSPSGDFMVEFGEGQPMLFSGDDNSTRPNEGWLWANDYEICWSAMEDCKSDLRAWGYTMWDSSRLSAWGIFRKPYSREISMKRREENYKRAEEQEVEDERTAKLRNIVYQRGGSGYWTESESQIVWGNPRFPVWPDQRTGNPDEWAEPYPGVSTQVLYEIGEGLRSRLGQPKGDPEPVTAISARKNPSLFSKLRIVLGQKGLS